MDHLEITERAILNVTVQVCRAVASAEGADFSFPVGTPLQWFLLTINKSISLSAVSDI